MKGGSGRALCSTMATSTTESVLGTNQNMIRIRSQTGLFRYIHTHTHTHTHTDHTHTLITHTHTYTRTHAHTCIFTGGSAGWLQQRRGLSPSFDTPRTDVEDHLSPDEISVSSETWNPSGFRV
jgi:hypothetical protein